MEYFIAVFFALYAILMILTFTDIFYRIYNKDKTFQLYWVFFVFLCPLLGSILYFHFKRGERMRKSIFR